MPMVQVKFPPQTTAKASMSRVGAPPVYNPYASVQRMAAPPVYNPTASVQRMTAPPIYRPDHATQVQPMTTQWVYKPAALNQKMAAPTVYKSNIAMQRAASAPSVYKPGISIQRLAVPQVYKPLMASSYTSVMPGRSVNCLIGQVAPSVHATRSAAVLQLSRNRKRWTPAQREQSQRFWEKKELKSKRKEEARKTPGAFLTRFKGAGSEIFGERDRLLGWTELYATIPSAALYPLLFNDEGEKRKDGIREGETIAELVSRNMDKITGSCGQTSSLLESIIDPASGGDTRKLADVNVEGVVSAINTANNSSVRKASYEYIRMTVRGHSFTIEIFKNTCRIYQSFFGEYSMAKDMQRSKTYPIDEFRTKIQKALRGALDEDTRQALVDIFGVVDLGDASKLQISTYSQPPGLLDRLAKKLKDNKAKWEKLLNRKVTSVEIGDLF